MIKFEDEVDKSTNERNSILLAYVYDKDTLIGRVNLCRNGGEGNKVKITYERLFHKIQDNSFTDFYQPSKTATASYPELLLLLGEIAKYVEH